MEATAKLDSSSRALHQRTIGKTLGVATPHVETLRVQQSVVQIEDKHKLFLAYELLFFLFDL